MSQIELSEVWFFKSPDFPKSLHLHTSISKLGTTAICVGTERGHDKKCLSILI